MRIGWKQTYETGISKIDEQHRRLFDMVNELLDQKTRSYNERQIFSLLNGLVKYAEEHFATEEKYLSYFKYPKFEEHTRQHLAFLQEITKFAQKLEDHQANVFPQMLEFLKRWYFTHIGESDRLYVEYFVKHKLIHPAQELL
ncbi:MAG TPA: bacteriohemerythrin [Bacteroidota bacterium]|nr:bacteriohemerythrin [Bacteroidota bacterium]